MLPTGEIPQRCKEGFKEQTGKEDAVLFQDPQSLVVVSLLMLRALSHVPGATQSLVECQVTSAVLGTMAALRSAATVQQYCLDVLAKIALYQPDITEKVSVWQLNVWVVMCVWINEHVWLWTAVACWTSSVLSAPVKWVHLSLSDASPPPLSHPHPTHFSPLSFSFPFCPPPFFPTSFLLCILFFSLLSLTFYSSVSFSLFLLSDCRHQL